MKRVLKGLIEPECLTSYRVANPVGSWDSFKNDSQTCYAEIRSKAEADQRGLCAFCEIKIRQTNQQIAHFHPKSDKSSPKNWGLTWTNLILACKGGTQAYVKDASEYLPPLPENRSCDEHKENQIIDGIVLNPLSLPQSPRLFSFAVRSFLNRPGEIFDAVEIRPDLEACLRASIDPSLVIKTIEVFNLNCPRLARVRFSYYKPVEQQLRRLREQNFDEVRLRNALLKLAEISLSSTGGGWTSFFTMVRWHLGFFAEEYLRSIDYIG